MTALAASPWAPLVAVAGQKQIVLYNSDTAQLLGVLPFPEGIAHVLKFSRSGSLLLAGGGVGGKAGVVVVYDVKTGKRVFEVGDELDVVLAADINEDHTRIALGGPGRVVRIYSTADGSLVHEIRKHTEWIYALEFSPDGVLLATADRNGGMFVWEAETAREYQNLAGHKGAITDVSWRIDSNVLASASEDGTIKLWEMDGGKEIKNWAAHGGGAVSVEFARDGKLVSVGRDRLTKIWDGNGAAIRELPAFNDIATEVAFTHDAARVVAGDWLGEVRLSEAADGKQVGQLPPNPPTLEMLVSAHTAAVNAAVEAAKKTAAELAAAEAAVAEKAKANQGRRSGSRSRAGQPPKPAGRKSRLRSGAIGAGLDGQVASQAPCAATFVPGNSARRNKKHIVGPRGSSDVFSGELLDLSPVLNFHGGSYSRTNRAGQSAVIRPIFRVPQRLAAHDALGQDVEFFSRAGGRFGRGEFVVLGGRKILVMAVLQNRFKHIPHLPHRITPSN